jgi:hypothetical protein
MSNSNHEHATNHLQRDSIYLHDSTATEYRWGERLDNTMPIERPQADLPCRVDTVLVHQWHTRWREKETIRTDTIVTYETKTETVQVRYVPPFYKYCTIFALLVVLWWIWKRWGIKNFEF